MKVNSERISSNFARLAVVIFGLTAAGCISIPRASFDSYLQNFAVVKANAQDLYLRSSNIAEDIANRPDQEGSVTDRIKILDARKTALKLRLEAVGLLDRYNTILALLAAGSSADSLKGEVAGLQQSLSSFDLSSVTKLLEKSGPYLSLVAQGVALVEDAVKKRKFKEAVDAAQKPVAGIVDILRVDADDLEDILVQELKREQDPYRVQIDSNGSRFYKRLKTLKLSAEMEGLLGRVNAARKSMRIDNYKPYAYQPTDSVTDASPADIDSLTVVVGQIEISAVAYNKIQSQIAAQHDVIQSYKDALDATKKSFVALAGDIESSRIIATDSFVRQSLELRKAMLRLQEAR